jgi:hypothetical protein
MKIYLSGQISGIPLNKARKKFAKAAKIAENHGHAAVNPMDHNEYVEGKPWIDYMIESLELLKQCDGILLLDNYKMSFGAKIEKLAAERMELEIFKLNGSHIEAVIQHV